MKHLDRGKLSFGAQMNFKPGQPAGVEGLLSNAIRPWDTLICREPPTAAPPVRDSTQGTLPSVPV